ncbi:MAG: methionine ABC transporter ATP-binding protein [Succinivibrio sp.]|jgi:D-methionine transport system ATP-binding protein|nr:methionine ABC transporter ATP-binding protein [Succinivibrio sp.]MCI5577001.1 methionine ABC transporter ATP-binding protein [Succinivibrio sp.]MCI6449191.1 methionine ABC transporter ATP-binding protein [Succinivibrio sp.]MCI7773636.1 methionine ABC transporter ATP-binding protein [Succinivibrio sp.]MDD6068447.1 methionine ABC transporter ATP-binding protein [Succinivibrio sp.]
MSSTNETVVRFINITKDFTQGKNVSRALNHVSFEVNKGDICGLIGFSGAGKSTLLRMVNELETPTEGDVEVLGHSLKNTKGKKLRDIRKRIGMIFQEFNLLESKTVFDNVAIALKLNGESKDYIQQRVTTLLEFVGLSDKKDSYPYELSGGQKQRVGIARALATKPEILLCDEATSALDPDTTESILNLLSKINKELQVTILFVTHTIRVVQKICNKVAILEHGNLVEFGNVIDIFSNPQSTIAKKFVGAVIPNVIPKGIKDELLKYDGKYKLIRIFFHAQNATDDVIWQINNRLNVHTNVMFASVSELQDVVLSVITLQITGTEDDFKKVYDYISSRQIEFEEISL